jgi:hypothetical protein
MKNLNAYVERVWAAVEREDKIKYLSEMVEVSTAKKLTKIKTLRDMVHMNSTQLDFLASNYSMSGMGMKVMR